MRGFLNVLCMLISLFYSLLCHATDEPVRKKGRYEQAQQNQIEYTNCEIMNLARCVTISENPKHPIGFRCKKIML
jgi:hypothetical protein